MPNAPENEGLDFDSVLGELQLYGLLLASDKRLISVTTLVSGASVSGSWWASPHSHKIFNVMRSLTAHPDVTLAKLINQKVTYVHRKLWGALVAVGNEQAPWQFRSLSPQARELFRQVTRTGAYSTNQAPDPKHCGQAAAELEARLLVCAEEMHTESGSHAKLLLTWEQWCESRRFTPGSLALEEGKAQIEIAVLALPMAEPVRLSLPWR
jgi:hypothetical protein